MSMTEDRKIGEALKRSDCQLDTPIAAISGGDSVVEALPNDILLD
jgi:hypothetical protein